MDTKAVECIPAQTFYCACTTFHLSDWGACQPNGTQTRTMTAAPEPIGCIGAPNMIRQCAYQPPISSMACEVRIQYAQGDPTNPAIGQLGPWCDAAGVELAVAVMLARLLGAKP